MLKISKPLGIQKTTEYYHHEYGAADQRYYAEKGTLLGQWHGALAAQWGLVGAVREEEYNRLAQGQHPHTAEQLIKHRSPTEERPWIRNNVAWRNHMEDLFGDALLDRKDCFRNVPDHEARKRRKKETFEPSERVANRPPTERHAKLLEMHRIAADIFEENLAGQPGAGARGYLDSRHVTERTAREFGLGLSDASGQQLARKLEHFGPELMEASGLFFKDKRGQFQDRFQGRLMFPIQNATGEVVAFGARQWAAEIGPKYLNSPATEIYQKRAVLYNLNRAGVVSM